MDAFDGEVDIGPNEKEIGGGGASSGQPPVGAGTTGSSSSYSSSSSYVAFDPTQAILDGTMVPSAWCNEKSNIPQDARDMLDYLRDHNFTPPKGVKGGKEYLNSNKKLPTNATYREYDIYAKIKGVPRGPERIVISSDGIAYYTPDHYETFYPMRVLLTMRVCLCE